jgi:hypothetical protein
MTRWGCALLASAAIVLVLNGRSVKGATMDYHPAYLTGNMLFDYCQSNDRSSQGLCVGYIVGVSDMLSEEHLVCPAQNAPIGQIRDIVIKYLVNNPESRQYAASYLAMSALRTVFPCS